MSLKGWTHRGGLFEPVLGKMSEIGVSFRRMTSAASDQQVKRRPIWGAYCFGAANYRPLRWQNNHPDIAENRQSLEKLLDPTNFPGKTGVTAGNEIGRAMDEARNT
jgi:hypothetical protein